LSDQIAKNSPRELFAVINRLICPSTKPDLISSSVTCDVFSKFFAEKTNAIRASFSSVVVNPVLTDLTKIYFSQFELVSLSEIKNVILYLKRSLCPSDAVVLSILKEGVDIVSPSILAIISLQNGIVPLCLKQAIVEPYFKKTNLEWTLMT